ncbi:hypothetical protein, partial [Novipirellula sp.]|uniref:hypothetical protein n=1 Tax=Novipirellula sp. TaxID=2795430 RepID=UPI0035654F2D
DCMQINHRCLSEAQWMSTMREFSGDYVLPPNDALARVFTGAACNNMLGSPQLHPDPIKTSSAVSASSKWRAHRIL